MAIAPLVLPQPATTPAINFAPLATLGQTQQEPTLADLERIYGATPSSTPNAPASPSTPPGRPLFDNDTDLIANHLKSISGIESGGRYNLLGPVTSSGDQAIGKYQIMGANVPEWTRAALGTAMTPDEFRNNPQAQEATARHRWSYYENKYGPDGAARAWFAGEGGMNNPKAKDLYGTTVAEYSRRFNAGLGGQ